MVNTYIDDIFFNQTGELMPFSEAFTAWLRHPSLIFRGDLVPADLSAQEQQIYVNKVIETLAVIKPCKTIIFDNISLATAKVLVQALAPVRDKALAAKRAQNFTLVNLSADVTKQIGSFLKSCNIDFLNLQGAVQGLEHWPSMQIGVELNSTGALGKSQMEYGGVSLNPKFLRVVMRDEVSQFCAGVVRFLAKSRIDSFSIQSEEMSDVFRQELIKHFPGLKISASFDDEYMMQCTFLLVDQKRKRLEEPPIATQLETQAKPETLPSSAKSFRRHSPTFYAPGGQLAQGGSAGIGAGNGSGVSADATAMHTAAAIL
jgi:hypothetical protein